MSGSRTISLDGADWQVRGYLGIDAARNAALRREQPAGPDRRWLPAHVPGVVLDDLWRAGEVADPYHERDSRLVEWVPERAWLYHRRLEGPAPQPGERAWLRFEGLDHAGEVFLDGRSVAVHEGMFVPFEVEVSDALRAGAVGGRAVHDLAVVIAPAPESEPQVGRTSRVRQHKSRMGYGWDFCPRLIQQGLWQSVALELAGSVRITDVWARPDVAATLRSARIDVRVGLDTRSAGRVDVAASLTAPDGREVAQGEATREVPAGPGASVDLALHVAEPALWWPNGQGAAALHALRVTVTGADGRPAVERRIAIGLRRLRWLPNEGAPADARPYTVEVNGRRIPINGWNWVPMDALYGVPRQDRLAHLIGLAARANVNLLRVWGGGLIETPAFYEACDRAGILVWQEFIQSSSGVESQPSEDPGFVERMVHEAEAIVPSRRNHPSLAVWCGGNELEGADGPLDDGGSPVLAALHAVVERLDPGRAWLPTSPSGPRFHNRLDVIEADPDGLHDVHGPWEHQGLAAHHALYDRGTSLLSSEFGVEGMTNRRTHERLIDPDHRWPATRANPVYAHLGDWWNNEPVVQMSFGGGIGDLETLRRASQWLQAEGLRYAVEANRRRWPRNSGSIPWQFDESYPNAWCTAAIDHRGDPKPAYHAVARAYRPTVICARHDGPAVGAVDPWTFGLWAWSANGAVQAGTATWRLIDVAGDCLADGSVSVVLDGDRPVRLTADAPMPAPAPALGFLDLWLSDDTGRVRASNRYLIAAGADLGEMRHVAPAEVETIRVDAGSSGKAGTWRLTLTHTGGPAALGLRIEDDRPAEAPGWAVPEDDGFDLLPGGSRTLEVTWSAAPEHGRRLRISGWNVAPMVVA